jgi:hypothetical protein
MKTGRRAMEGSFFQPIKDDLVLKVPGTCNILCMFRMVYVAHTGCSTEIRVGGHHQSICLCHVERSAVVKPVLSDPASGHQYPGQRIQTHKLDLGITETELHFNKHKEGGFSLTESWKQAHIKQKACASTQPFCT